MLTYYRLSIRWKEHPIRVGDGKGGWNYQKGEYQFLHAATEARPAHGSAIFGAVKAYGITQMDNGEVMILVSWMRGEKLSTDDFPTVAFSKDRGDTWSDWKFTGARSRPMMFTYLGGGNLSQVAAYGGRLGEGCDDAHAASTCGTRFALVRDFATRYFNSMRASDSEALAKVHVIIDHLARRTARLQSLVCRNSFSSINKARRELMLLEPSLQFSGEMTSACWEEEIERLLARVVRSIKLQSTVPARRSKYGRSINDCLELTGIVSFPNGQAIRAHAYEVN